MNIESLKNFSRNLIYIDVTDSVIGLICEGAGALGVPFPECKIVETSHLSFFAPRPHMPRYFQLEGDSARGVHRYGRCRGRFSNILAAFDARR